MVLQKPNFLRSHPSRSHQATPPAPRFESSRCFLNGASGETKTNSCATSKWQIQLSQCRLPFLGGTALAPLGGMIMPPNGVQGQRPWHAFGDFRRETKVTRGGGAERPLVGSAEGQRPSHIGPRRGPRPCQKAPRGNAAPPPLPIPRNEQKVASQRATPEGKNQKKEPPPLAFLPALCYTLFKHLSKY